MVEKVASANWDGLIEKAVDEVSSGSNPLRVCVQSEDLQLPPKPAELLKFHGCAIKAAECPEQFRPYIVGRYSQIADWRSDAKTAGMFGHLRDIISTKPTLMLGLSVQDFNIQSLFAEAREVLSWDWPGDRPSYVFSEDKIGVDQVGLLKNVYKEHYTTATRVDIKQGAHLRAYANPLLPALIPQSSDQCV